MTTTGLSASSAQSFSADYHEARDKFVASAQKAGATLRRYTCPAMGPHGETLYTDAAWLGDPNATKVLVTISGTHGVE